MRKKVKAICLMAMTAMLTLFSVGCFGVPDKIKEWACEHEYSEDGEIVKAATCTEEGEEVWTCLKCGKTKTEDTPMLEHTYDEGRIVEEATCTEIGLKERTCITCGFKIEEDIALLPHNVQTVEQVDPTCTTAGTTAYTYCSDCNQYLTKKQEIPALGHSPTKINGVAATCTTTGLTAGEVCTVCNEVFLAQETVAMLPHTEITVAPAVAATCTTAGSTAQIECEVCGEVLEAQEEIPLLSHEYDENGVCSVCGFSLSLSNATVVDLAPIELYNGEPATLSIPVSADDNGKRIERIVFDGEDVSSLYMSAINNYIDVKDGKMVICWSDVRNHPVYGLLLRDFTLPYGDFSVYVSFENGGSYIVNATACTKVLTSAEEFFTVIEEDLSGYYVLGQDIDFSAGTINAKDEAGWKTIGWKAGMQGYFSDFNKFCGTLDGQGYALKNITMFGYDGSTGVKACLFGSTEGATIKNVMVDMTIPSSLSQSTKDAGLIGFATTTTVSNCVVRLRTSSGGYGTQTTVGAIAGTLGENSKIENCVAILDVAQGVSGTHNFGTMVGAAGGNADGIYNSYGIYDYTIDDGVTANLKASGGLTNMPGSEVFVGYSGFAYAVTSLSEDDGWNTYWTLSAGHLYFGDELIY